MLNRIGNTHDMKIIPPQGNHVIVVAPHAITVKMGGIDRRSGVGSHSFLCLCIILRVGINGEYNIVVISPLHRIIHAKENINLLFPNRIMLLAGVFVIFF